MGMMSLCLCHPCAVSHDVVEVVADGFVADRFVISSHITFLR